MVQSHDETVTLQQVLALSPFTKVPISHWDLLRDELVGTEISLENDDKSRTCLRHVSLYACFYNALQIFELPRADDETRTSQGFQGFGFGDGGFQMSFGIGAFPFGIFATAFNINDGRPPPGIYLPYEFIPQLCVSSSNGALSNVL